MLLKELLDVCVITQKVKVTYFDGVEIIEHIKPVTLLKYELESLLDNEIICISSFDNIINVIL